VECLIALTLFALSCTSLATLQLATLKNQRSAWNALQNKLENAGLTHKNKALSDYETAH